MGGFEIKLDEQGNYGTAISSNSNPSFCSFCAQSNVAPMILAPGIFLPLVSTTSTLGLTKNFIKLNNQVQYIASQPINVVINADITFILSVATTSSPTYGFAILKNTSTVLQYPVLRSISVGTNASILMNTSGIIDLVTGDTLCLGMNSTAANISIVVQRFNLTIKE